MVLTPDLASALTLANGLPQAQGTGPRIPMVLTCTSWRARGLPAIQLAINPQNIGFRQNKRITKKNTRGGTAYFHWTDQNGRNNDILEMSMKGTTGSILTRDDPPTQKNAIAETLQNLANALSGGPKGGIEGGDGRRKLLIWARLYSLTREAMIDPTTKQPNVFEILYRSPLFPAPILLQGFFNNVLEFSEDAQKPFMVDWSTTFVVQKVNPSLDVLSQYLANVLANPNRIEGVIAGAAAATASQQQSDQSLANHDFKNG
jgi:hypothetical protein